MPLIQDARLLSNKRLEVGLAGAAAVPVDKALFEPDGAIADAYRDQQNQDLRYIPLVHAVGWARYSLGGFEVQGSFNIPGFVLGLGIKTTLIGRKRGSPLAIALIADGAVGFVPVDFGAGGTVLTTVRVAADNHVDLTFGARVGNYPALYQGLNVTPTVAVHWGGATRYHVAVGGTIPTGVGDSVPALWIGGGFSETSFEPDRSGR